MDYARWVLERRLCQADLEKNEEARRWKWLEWRSGGL